MDLSIGLYWFHRIEGTSSEDNSTVRFITSAATPLSLFHVEDVPHVVNMKIGVLSFQIIVHND